MLPEPQLRDVLTQVQPKAMHGPYCRCIGYHHLGPPQGQPARAPTNEPLWGMGSRVSGARFTPPGAFETIYLAEDPVTALAEVALVIRHPQAPPLNFRTPPWVLITVDGMMLSVLDLTDAGIQAAVGTTPQELTGEWRYTQAEGKEAATQLLGRIGYQTGRFDGIRYPSSKNPPHGVCMAVFPNRLNPPAFLEVYDPHGNLAQRLP